MCDAVRSRRRPCQRSTTSPLELPIARCAGRPPSAATLATPIAIAIGSRTAVASGPTHSSTDRVSRAIAAASANASHVAISPTQSSG